MKNFLIVVDMQNDFVDGALGTAEAQKILPAVCERIKNFDGEIIATFDTHGENYMDTAEGKKLPVPHCIKGSRGFLLNEEVSEALGDRFTAVEKPTFGSTALPGIIEKAACGEDFSIELIGLCTDICVVSNALLLKAHFPEKKISVCEGCSAGVTPESHAAAIATMKSCQIDIV